MQKHAKLLSKLYFDSSYARYVGALTDVSTGIAKIYNKFFSKNGGANSRDKSQKQIILILGEKPSIEKSKQITKLLQEQGTYIVLFFTVFSLKDFLIEKNDMNFGHFWAKSFLPLSQCKV